MKVSGVILDLMSPINKEVEVCLIPRRWAYTVYYRHHEWSGSNDTITYEVIDCNCDERLRIMWDDPTYKTFQADLYHCEYTGSPTCELDPPVTSGDGVMVSEIVDCTYYVGIFWARCPHDFICNNYSTTDDAFAETSEIPFFDSSDSAIDGKVSHTVNSSKGVQTYYGYKKLSTVRTLEQSAD
jgi:hypothetical protein